VFVTLDEPSLAAMVAELLTQTNISLLTFCGPVCSWLYLV